jgi:hypothetical protein
MGIVRRILAVVVLLVSAVVLLASLAGAAAAWPVRTRLNAEATRLANRLETLLGAVSRGADQADAVLVQAETRLGEFREAQAKADADPKESVALRLVATRLKSEYASQLGDVRENLDLAAQAAVVADSLLSNADAWPLDVGERVDAGRLREVGGRLGDAANLADELSAQLENTPEGKPVPPGVSERASRIAEALRAVRAAVQEFAARVAQVAAREAALKPRVFFWIDAGAGVAAAVLLWVALSQISLMAHAWGWLWKKRRPAAG